MINNNSIFGVSLLCGLKLVPFKRVQGVQNPSLTAAIFPGKESL
jgi:hypothetical protein